MKEEAASKKQPLLCCFAAGFPRQNGFDGESHAVRGLFPRQGWFDGESRVVRGHFPRQTGFGGLFFEHNRNSHL